MEVTELAIYPVKSTRQIVVSEARVTARGFEGDRRWLLAGDNGRFITQRQHPILALVATEVLDDGLRLSRPDAEPLMVQRPINSPTTVTVWKDECTAVDAGDEAAEWFSQLLQLPCRLFYQPDDAIRPVNPRYGQPRDHTSFADGFPFLLTNEMSLQELNERLPSPITMNRFRPNIVINGHTPFAEDHWQRIKIGAVTFRLVKPCSRCVMTTVNPQTGAKEGKEPLKTLSGFRRTEQGVLFGQNMIPDQDGVIKVGDAVTVLA